MKTYNCPYCNQKLRRELLTKHIEKEHDDEIPVDYTPYRLVYDIVNDKDGHGTCTECGKPTVWNEKRQKYERLCGDPNCYKKVKATYQKRMMKVYNKIYLTDDPKHQEKMLAGRKISGQYKWSDGKMFTYTGQYEKKLMEFLDKTLEYRSDEIIAPGPVLEYKYQGKLHHWITDFLILPYNLIIEVKDGGDNPNNRVMIDYRAKQVAKETMITNLGTYSYIRLTNNDFGQLLGILAELKMQVVDDNAKTPLYRIHEDAEIGSLQESLEFSADTLEDKMDIAENEFDELIPEDSTYLGPNNIIDRKRFITDHPIDGHRLGVFITIKPNTDFVNKEVSNRFGEDMNHLWMDLQYPGSDSKRKNWRYRSFWIDPDDKLQGIAIGVEVK